MIKYTFNNFFYYLTIIKNYHFNNNLSENFRDMLETL